MLAVTHGGMNTKSVSHGKLCTNIPVLAVENLSLPTETITESIALTPATSQTVSERSIFLMSDNYRNRLESYLASMLQAKQMLSMGILTPEDYAAIDTIMNEKYGISSCSLYRGIDLIYDGFRVNMSHYKEVTQCQEE